VVKTKRGEAWREAKKKARIIHPFQRKLAELFPHIDFIAKADRLFVYAKGGTEPSVVCRRREDGDWDCGSEHRFAKAQFALAWAAAKLGLPVQPPGRLPPSPGM